MKKILSVFILVFSVNAMAIPGVGGVFGAELAIYMAVNIQRVKHVKTVTNYVKNEADRYDKERNWKQRDFILSQLIEKINRSKKGLPSFIQQYASSKVYEINELRSLISNKRYGASKLRFQELYKNINDIHYYMNIL